MFHMFCPYLLGLNFSSWLISFLQINPQHNVPCFVDEDVTLNESRAICVYIVQKFGGKASSLFPDNIVTQAKINQRLYFDATVFWKAFGDILVSKMSLM